jgi:hypothetical protein
MTPDEENTALWVETARQREQIAVLVARVHALEARLRRARRALALGALAVLLAAGVGLLVAWRHGAFESRLMYWRERGQDCGRVAYGPNGALWDRSAAERAVACFAAAQARCKAAALTRDAGGTDTEETDMFVVEPWDTGGGCDVAMRFSSGIVGNPRTTTTSEVQCARVTSANGALTIGGCQGFGDITVP